MTRQVHTIRQAYWRSETLPQLELRSTRNSLQPYRPHSHRQLSIGAVVAGQTRVRYRGRERLARAGELVLIEPGEIHSCNPCEGQPRSYHMLYLDTDWCLRRLAAWHHRPVTGLRCDPFAIADPALLTTYLSLVEALRGGQPGIAENALDALLAALFSRYVRPSPAREPQHPQILELQHALLRQLDQPPSLAVLARRYGYREETIIRLFNRELGLSPRALLNNRRIEQAKQLLKAGQVIAAVAADLGFSDQSHFHKTFVNYTASTPRQYQQPRSISDNNRRSR